MFNKYVDIYTIEKISNYAKEHNNAIKNNDVRKSYEYFMRTLSNLPMGFEMWMRITTNYRQLKTIYLQRKKHKLKEEWGYFCEWCKLLPYFNELTGVEQ